jgi:hypothetical protein
MEAAEAISLVTEWILWENLDYPTDALDAERFEVGWRVYAPVDGLPVFLVGDTGRIEEVSSSIPPKQAQAEFAAQELIETGSDGSELLEELERQIRQAESEGPSGEGG